MNKISNYYNNLSHPAKIAGGAYIGAVLVAFFGFKGVKFSYKLAYTIFLIGIGALLSYDVDCAVKGECDTWAKIKSFIIGMQGLLIIYISYKNTELSPISSIATA